MRDTWYADQRDIVKWSLLAHLAEAYSLATIVQVAFLRAGRRDTLPSGDDEVAISPAVWGFFRDVTAVRRLGDILHCRIVVIDQPFVPQRRQQYRQAAVASVRSVDTPKIVLLDPDTGIAPRKPSGKHITLEDIACIWDAFESGDWIAVYQHRSRSKTWKEDARARFAAVCGNDIRAYTARRIASDVLFLVKRKP